MRKETLRTVLLFTAVCGLTAGCQAPHHILVRQPPTPAVTTGDLLLTEPMIAPHPRVEVTPLESTNVWVPGYWLNINGKWVRIHGHQAPTGQAITPELTGRDTTG